MKEKFIENGIEYVREGDYYIPNLKAPEGKFNIGKYGRLHSIFILARKLTLESKWLNSQEWYVVKYHSWEYFLQNVD